MSISTRRHQRTKTQSHILWGAYIDGSTYGTGFQNAPWDANTWNTFEANAGKKVSVMHYGQDAWWNEPFAPSAADKCVARGAYPCIDMRISDGTLASVAAGTYDSSLQTWAVAVKAWGKPFFFRWCGEMNGTWSAYGAEAAKNPAVFINAWRHMYDVVAAVGATNVTWVWCPNIDGAGMTPLASLYPGDAYVDWLGVDGYNWTRSGGLDVGWLTFSEVFSATYNQLIALAPTKPIMIAEIASNEDPSGSKADWIRDALLVQLPQYFPKVKALLWFEWPIYENGVTQQWPIESSAAANAAFAQGIASPYYLAGGAGTGYGSAPLLGKVPVPR